MDFQERLRRAAERGRRRGKSASAEREAARLSEEDLRQEHGRIRLELSDRITRGIEQIAAQFPGFETETTYGDRGWGAACSRDDVRMHAGKRENLYSRLELAIRPFSHLHVLELAGKATVHNREIFNRTYFEELPDVDPEAFRERIDAWMIEFAERFAAADAAR